MASVSGNKNNGRKLIQYVDESGTRRTVRLGKVSKAQAEQAKRHIEAMLAAKVAGAGLDRQTAIWLSEVGDVMYGRLAKLGLCEAQPKPIEQSEEPHADATVAEWIQRCIDNRTDLKPGTIGNFNSTRNRATKFFGSKKISEVTAGDALDFRRWLLTNYAEATVRKTTGNCRQFWDEAIAHELIESNPFRQRGIPCTAVSNPDRFHFVSRSDTDRILVACPDSDWRAIVALCRYGGFRCPSEVLLLKWADIEWESGRVLVTSPKTEHHPGGESRLVPLFPELRDVLSDCFEQAPEGAEHVVTRYQYAKNSNLRTQMEKIVRRAGVKPWPKLFQNMRSTRETELAESFPMHVVCKWIGNSELVAAKHYLQTTDEHFDRAASVTKSAAECAAVGDGIEMHCDESENEKARKTPEKQPFPGKRDDKRWALQDSNL